MMLPSFFQRQFYAASLSLLSHFTTLPLSSILLPDDLVLISERIFCLMLILCRHACRHFATLMPLFQDTRRISARFCRRHFIYFRRAYAAADFE